MALQSFSSYYEFSVTDDYYYSIYKYTPATLNREHTHSDVEEGIAKQTQNWECVAQDSSRRRGSDKLYCVDDEFYVLCSRTGMEKAGNSIHMSSNTPHELRFSILSTVFRNVFERKFKVPLTASKQQLLSQSNLQNCFSLPSQKETSDEHIEAYYNELAETVRTLVTEYFEAETLTEIKEAVTIYSHTCTDIYRQYTDFTPSMLSQVLSNITDTDGWKTPNNIDSGKKFTVLTHTDKEVIEGTLHQLLIIIDEIQTPQIQLIDSGTEDTVLEEETYETQNQLKHLLTKYMEVSPENV